MLRSCNRGIKAAPYLPSFASRHGSLITRSIASHTTRHQRPANLEPSRTELEEVQLNTPTKMMGSEAFVETLVAQGVTNIFGIVGSAFMDALDLFPEAGIRFLSVQHEQNAAHMADGYSRASGRHGVCTGQNGPGEFKVCST